MEVLGGFEGGPVLTQSLPNCGLYEHRTEQVTDLPLQNMELEFPSSEQCVGCLLYTSPSPRDATLSRMPSSA